MELHELALVGQVPPQLLKEDLKEEPPLKEEDVKRAAVAGVAGEAVAGVGGLLKEEDVKRAAVAGVAGEAVADAGGHLEEEPPLQEEDVKRLSHTTGSLATAALAVPFQ